VTPPVRSDDLPKATVMLRHTGELLAHPCRCARKNCTLGEHIWRATKAMGPGPRAANLDPTSRGWRYDENGDPVPNDVTGEAAIDPDPADLHVEYMTLLNEAVHAAARLGTFIDRYRPDRTIPLPDDDTDSQWCRNCLAYGICNPPYRGEGASARCRSCYEFHLTYPRLERPESLVRAQHEGRRITQRMVDQAVREARAEMRSKRKRKKAG